MHPRQSTGLGSVISKRIVEKHGRAMRGESPGKGRGTTVPSTRPKGSCSVALVAEEGAL